MKRKRITVDDMLATYSLHVSRNYPSPEQFRENLDRVLAGKRERFPGEEYIAALETNVVFLRDLIVEGEALLDVLFDTRLSMEMASSRVNALLAEMEDRVRVKSEQRRIEAFVEGNDNEFAELRKLRAAGQSAYTERLEFTYRYLMVLKVLIFEFFNVMESITSRHPIARTTAGSRRQVLNHIELTANYYLGTVEVKDSDGTGG
jgi:hypothetical protein